MANYLWAWRRTQAHPKRWGVYTQRDELVDGFATKAAAEIYLTQCQAWKPDTRFFVRDQFPFNNRRREG